MKTAASSTSISPRTIAAKLLTHLIAWAVVRALDTFPQLNDGYTEVDGTSAR